MKKLIWLIIIAGATYYGYNNWMPTANNNETVDSGIEKVTTESSTWYTHKNDSYANYSIQYPSNWNINNDDEQTIITSPDKLDSVVISLRKNNITNSKGIQTIKEIAGQQVLIIEGEDPDDGSPAKFVIFNLSNDQKLEIRGFGSIFDKMIKTLVINSEQPQAEKKQIDSTDEKIKEVVEQESEKTATINNEKEPTIKEAEEIIDNEKEEFVIKIFYQKNPGDNCSTVVGLAKEIDTRYNTDEVNALVTLTQGLSPEESNQGYTTSIPYGTRLRNLDIRGGTATADFNSTLNADADNCSMDTRRAQITETLLQFPDINQVIITVDGNPLIE